MRLFYCCELPEAVKIELFRIAQPLRALEARVTWVRPENFHITLKFLGEVHSDSVEALKILGAQVAASSQRFELTFDIVGAFPTVHRPRVLWIGASSVPSEILSLHERLERELVKMGFGEEEHFTPHVTVGRVKDERPMRAGQLSQIISQIAKFTCHTLITQLTLMESQLSPSGAIYTPVATWELGEGRAL